MSHNHHDAENGEDGPGNNTKQRTEYEKVLAPPLQEQHCMREKSVKRHIQLLAKLMHTYSLHDEHFEDNPYMA